MPDGRPSASPLKSAVEHTVLIRSILPELDERVDRLLEAVTIGGGSFAPVPAHGDLHEAQILVRDGAIAGLLDIDTSGIGYRIDDWANFLGHLAVWKTSGPRDVRPRIERFARGILARADAETDEPAELRRRVAAVIIGMATGPFRAQTQAWPADTRRRIALAERWAADAGEATDKSCLTPTSRPSHVRV